MKKINIKNKFLNLCEKNGMRKTKALISVIDIISQLKKPISLEEIDKTIQKKENCDQVTIFRIMEKLATLGLVKRYWFNSRRSYYFLNDDEKHNDFIICQKCETIEIIKADCPFENNKDLKKFENEVAKQSAFKKLHHKLEFFGLCLNCQ